MRVHVVYAHPIPTSLTGRLHATVVEGLTEAGHEVDDLDLYAAGFDPVLSPEHRAGYLDAPGNRAPVEAYVARLQAADALVLCHPVWNFGWPAILKGYFDRVFLPEVAFVFGKNRLGPGLSPTSASSPASRPTARSAGGHAVLGDPPRKNGTRFLRAVCHPRVKVGYHALYDVDRTGADAGRGVRGQGRRHDAGVLTMRDPDRRAVRRLDPRARAAADAPPALAFDAVSMTYADGTEALDDISLTIAPGEFVSIVGPSGCGKSTLARIASGLVTHTGGAVRIDREHLAFTFQEPTLLPWRRVLGNVELLMELRGVPARERQRIAREQIALVGLDGFEDRYPRSLSGGMKMRASLARSLALDPSVFLFDEPFGALDEITRERLIDELSALYVARGFTGFFITHSIPEAVFLSSRVVVDDGPGLGASPPSSPSTFPIRAGPSCATTAPSSKAAPRSRWRCATRWGRPVVEAAA